MKRYDMETLIDEKKIKDLFKQAIIEAIEEKKEVVYDLLVEVMEDIAMVRAIQDGENSGPASRDEIFQILEAK
jgi:spore coat polysaccharide biosynthesis protein SpsF (cytidylyltransferase family)